MNCTPRQYNSITARINRLHDEPAVWLCVQPLSASDLQVISSYQLYCFMVSAAPLRDQLCHATAHTGTSVTSSAVNSQARSLSELLRSCLFSYNLSTLYCCFQKTRRNKTKIWCYGGLWQSRAYLSFVGRSVCTP